MVNKYKIIIPMMADNIREVEFIVGEIKQKLNLGNVWIELENQKEGSVKK